jgi:hypothetical protein
MIRFQYQGRPPISRLEKRGYATQGSREPGFYLYSSYGIGSVEVAAEEVIITQHFP